MGENFVKWSGPSFMETSTPEKYIFISLKTKTIWRSNSTNLKFKYVLVFENLVKHVNFNIFIETNFAFCFIFRTLIVQPWPWSSNSVTAASFGWWLMESHLCHIDLKLDENLPWASWESESEKNEASARLSLSVLLRLEQRARAVDELVLYNNNYGEPLPREQIT